MRIPPSRHKEKFRDGSWVEIFLKSMISETKNWAVVAAVMEAQGAANSQMYRRAKAMAEGKADQMQTSYPAAPHSLSVA